MALHPPEDDLAQRAAGAAELLRLVGNEHRLQVLCVLRAGEASVGDLARRLGLSPSALSQHLARLRAARLVEGRREAQTIYYRIIDRTVLALVEALAQIMDQRRAGGRA